MPVASVRFPVVTVFPTGMPELGDYLNQSVSSSISLDGMLGG